MKKMKVSVKVPEARLRVGGDEAWGRVTRAVSDACRDWQGGDVEVIVREVGSRES